MTTKYLGRALVLAAALNTAFFAPAQGEEFHDRLREFVNGLRVDYAPTINTAHEFMIASYYYNLGLDLQLAAGVLTETIARIRHESTSIAARLQNVEIVVADIEANREPSQAILPAHRTAFFAYYTFARLHREFTDVVSDVERLTELHKSFCSPERVTLAQQLFDPARFYASTIFNVVSPPTPDFGGHFSITFDADGNLTSVEGGAGTGQQLPQGYTDEEHAIVWGTGAGAATIAQGLGAGSAAGPIGAAVVAVGYAILAGIQNEDRVKAIEEQVELMREADSIHFAVIQQVESKVPQLVEHYCYKVRGDENIAGPITTVAEFATGDDGAELLADLAITRNMASEVSLTLKAWAEDNLGLDVETLHRVDVAKTLAEMANQWQAEEEKARTFWTSKIAAALEAPMTDRRPMPDALSAAELSAALDNLTWGDCRFALCQPMFGEEVHVEEHAQVAASWLWLRQRLMEKK